ncbi:MAG: MerR family transcriptional regulator [Firmicutes bacterium]|nr:MerR family transcriptional regulator [Bacillota bacterium]
MALRNCSNCGTLFNAINPNMRLCAQCEEDEQERFDRVKEYLKEHATATVIEITKATGVERKEIFEWVRSGRIEIAGIEGLGIQCESCGTAITSGRFCVQCAVRMQQDAKRALGGRKSQRESAPRSKSTFHAANSIMRRRRDD